MSLVNNIPLKSTGSVLTLQEVIDRFESIERGMNAQINVLSVCPGDISADDAAALLTLHLENLALAKKELALLEK